MDNQPALVQFAIRTSAGTLQGRIPVPPRPMRLGELAWNIMSLDDRLIAMDVRKAAATGGKVSCGKGCAACCRHLVAVSAPEAWMLADLVAAFPREQKVRQLERFGQARDRILALGFAGRFLTPCASHEELLAFGLDYFFLGIPCPFLEEKSCSIYANRPMVCREHLVTSPAEFCSNPRDRRVVPLPISLRLPRLFAHLTVRLQGGDLQVIPLMVALDWAEEHREEGMRVYDSTQLILTLLELMNAPPEDPESA